MNEWEREIENSDGSLRTSKQFHFNSFKIFLLLLFVLTNYSKEGKPHVRRVYEWLARWRLNCGFKKPLPGSRVIFFTSALQYNVSLFSLSINDGRTTTTIDLPYSIPGHLIIKSIVSILIRFWKRERERTFWFFVVFVSFI